MESGIGDEGFLWGIFGLIGLCRNEFYNSKEGRRLEAQATAEAEANAETV